MADKRRAKRKMAVVPVQIDTADRKARLGVTRDVSTSGTLFLSNSKYEIGEHVSVTMYVTSRDEDVQLVEGTVVRVQRLGTDIQWRYAMAIRFDRALPLDKEAAFQEYVE